MKTFQQWLESCGRPHGADASKKGKEKPKKEEKKKEDAEK